MAYELITDWSGYRQATERLLAIAKQDIRIYDEDLLALELESPSSIRILQSFLRNARRDALQIAVRHGEALQSRQPRLAHLLTLFSHVSAAQQTPEHLASLRDNMLIADRSHALIRFDHEQPRSKLLIDEPEAVQPYLKRFNEIWAEGGEALGSARLGL